MTGLVSGKLAVWFCPFRIEEKSSLPVTGVTPSKFSSTTTAWAAAPELFAMIVSTLNAWPGRTVGG
jgi:hypothetical protein